MSVADRWRTVMERQRRRTPQEEPTIMKRMISMVLLGATLTMG
ncbi:MAG: hypothetical protein JWM12_3103, partial [Ilumatobacteraceae bacterium]|nr:hypothetical protein [Ilumatobacteraceae bacterium]